MKKEETSSKLKKESRLWYLIFLSEMLGYIFYFSIVFLIDLYSRNMINLVLFIIIFISVNLIFYKIRNYRIKKAITDIDEIILNEVIKYTNK